MTQKIDQKFPEVDWTGGSNIHRSFASGMQLPQIPPKEIIVLLRKAKIAGHIFRLLQSKFASFEEWLFDEALFEQYLLVDCWRHMNNQPDSESRQKLKNPVTGNRFHRMALVNGLVGGIRFWCDPNPQGYIFGYRFRIEAQNEEDQKTRDRVADDRERLAEEIEVLEEVTFDVAEPPKEVVETFIKHYAVELN